MEKHGTDCKRHEFFGFGWEFHFGDLSYEEAVKEGVDFRPVQLPHDWLMDYEAKEKDPKSGAMNWNYGIGIYRKCFELDPANEGRTLKLLFDGVYQNSTVYLNGKELGNNYCGYIPFEYDITDAVRYDAPNVVVVRVNNSEQPNTRWYSGSGIDRDVWLSSMDTAHVATDGTYIVTDSIDNGVADLTVVTELDNDSPCDRELVLKSSYIGPDGKLWAAFKDPVILGSGARQIQLIRNFSIKDPMLWSDSCPHLYTLVSELFENGELIDRYETRFGIRTICFDPDKGFLINGNHVKLQGMAIHNEAGQLGAAVPIKVWRDRFEKLKKMGCNAIRTAHNPADPLILDLMDEMGLYCMDEFFDEWTICKTSKSRLNPDVPVHGYAEHWDELHVKDTETIIRRDRNHPSVVLWSAGNECDEAYTVDGWEVMKELQELIHRLDPTRPVTEGTNPLARKSSYTLEKFFEFEDVYGCNWYSIWAPKGHERRAELFMEPDKIRHPDKCFLITETGGCGGSRGNYNFPKRREKGSGPFRGGAYFSAPVQASKQLRYITTHDYVSGVFYWTGVDYMGESAYPHRGGENSPIGLDNNIKDNFYFYKSMWKRDEPMVYIYPHWNMDVPEGTILPVICYTSCPSVELFLNGRSYGEKAILYPADGIDQWPEFDRTKPWANTDDLFLSWDVPFEKGEVTAIGYDREGNEIARYTVKTVGNAAAVDVQANSACIEADGRDVVLLDITLKDKDGNLAILSNDHLKVDVEGPGKILSMDNGNSLDHTLGRCPERDAYYGRLFAVIQSERGVSGTIRVTVSGEGLEPAAVEIESK